MTSCRSGDGFLACSDNNIRWGRFGAAGILFVLRGTERPEVLLQLRSHLSHEGGFWSCPGGALEEGEMSFAAAWRESDEELGPLPDKWRLCGQHIFRPVEDWQYTTFVVEVSHRFGSPRTFESVDIAWVPVGRVLEYSLHPGFESAWPRLRQVLDRDRRHTNTARSSESGQAYPLTEFASVGEASSTFYHGGPAEIALGGYLQPQASRILGGEYAVYATPSRAMALCFAAPVPHFDDNFCLGHFCNQLFLFENHPNALRRFYQRPGFLYEVSSEGFRTDQRTGIRSEFVGNSPVRVLTKRHIPNVLLALQTDPGVQIVPLY
jgi:8-oxo-dGTP diphosphatase